MSSPKHILVMAPGFPENEQDDRCIPALQEYLRAFARSHPEIRVTVIALHYPFSPHRYRWHGIDVVPLAGRNRNLNKAFLWYRALREAEKIDRSHPVDVVHSFWLGECAIIGAIASRRRQVLHCCTLMGQEMRSSNRYASLLARGRTQFIALSEPQARDFFRQTGKRVGHIIPWGIDDQRADDPDGRDIDLLGAGSLIAVKNFQLFLTTVRAMLRRRPGLRCVIAGDGPERSALAAMVKANGLEKNVTLTGMIPRHETLALMRRSRILLHPSLYEGFGYVFAEALASGAHIVSFDVGCAREHPHWHIARGDQEFLRQAEDVLSTVVDHAPANLFPLGSTLTSYAALYGVGEGTDLP